MSQIQLFSHVELANKPFRSDPNALQVVRNEDAAILRRLSAGETVSINILRHKALMHWARAQEIFVLADRWSRWANPYATDAVDGEGESQEAIRLYLEEHLPGSPDLLRQLDSLRGKVLGGRHYPRPDCLSGLITMIDHPKYRPHPLEQRR